MGKIAEKFKQKRLNPPFKPFDIGLLRMMPGANAQISGSHLFNCLARHVRGDWGHVSPSDASLNTHATFAGKRILSAYPINPAEACDGHGKNIFWIITEADRSSTIMLLPSEY